jgi:two-component system, cell cycle sensor histidine kinase and response regulator CckA
MAMKAEPQNESADGRQPLRVLCVEDAAEARLCLDELTQAGFQLVADRVDQREDFEKKLDAQAYDIVLADCQLPGWSGMAVLHALERRNLAIPCILVTGALEDELVAECLQKGAVDYILKDQLARLPGAVGRALTVKALRQERARAEKALQSSQEKFQKAFNASPDPMTISTWSEGTYIDCNESFLRVTGYQRDEVIGRLGGEARLWGEEERRALLKRLDEEGRIDDLEHRFKTKSREVRVGLLSAEIIEIEGQRSILAVTKDITERLKVQEQLRLSQRMEAIGRLAGGVAHDFNNLLTVITGCSYQLLQEMDPNDPRRQEVEEIKKASDRASLLTKQLLAFGRRQVLAPKILDLNGVVSNAEKMLRRVIGEDVDLTTVLGAELGRVQVDPGQIEQVVLNLALNARDAMPQGGRLTLETANVCLDEEYARGHVPVRPGAYVLLAVGDTGCGIDDETQAHIFEPFFTTKEQGKGTGLGLATVYGIIKQSGGYIWVSSELGRGTTFKIYLPRVNRESEEKQAQGSFSPRGSETILLVEDAEPVRRLVQRALKMSGYRILEARHGDEALEICAQTREPVHLMVTDVVMPRMGGAELAERLRSRYPQLKVLYMSGYTDEAVVRHGVREHSVAFLQKPFTPDAVARKVREVLDADAKAAGAAIPVD